MSHIEHTFFELLRSAIWDTTPNLRHIPTEEEWKDIYRISNEQTVTGIMLDAISKLPDEEKPGSKLRLQWIIQQKAIEMSNDKMNNALFSLLSLTEKSGITTYLLKGQGVAQNYPYPKHRVCGDIDIYFTEEHFEQAIKFFLSQNFDLNGDPDKDHYDTTYRDTKVEIHKRNATFYTKRLQKRYNEIVEKIIAADEAYVEIEDRNVAVLPPMANAMQLLSHMLRHIIFSGLGLRQVCDWGLFAYKYQNKIDTEQFIKNLKEVQLWETYKVITAIATDYLGLPKEYAVCKLSAKDRKLAKKTLRLIMKYGNFGHYGKHSKAKSKTEFLKSYIWKVKNCIRFRRLSISETFNYPIWQLHSIKQVLKR